MAGGHKDIAGKLPQLLPLQVLILEKLHIIRFIKGLTAYDAHVEGLARHAAYDVPGIGFHVMNIDRGTAVHIFKKFREGIGNIGGSGNAQIHLQCFFAVLYAQGLDLLLLHQDCLCIAQEFLPLFGGNHPAAGPVEDVASQVPFQLTDDFAQMGLIHIKILSRLCDGPSFFYFYRIFQIREIHSTTPG